MGWNLRLNSYKAEDLPEAKRLLKKAIDLDPDYAFAWALLAGCYSHSADDPNCSGAEREKVLDKIRECAQQATQIDPACSKAYSMLGLYHLSLREFDAAEKNANKAIELSPNHAGDMAISANILNKCGKPEEALDRIRRALRLSPFHAIWFLSIKGQILRVLGRYG